ncbi:DUF5683 domain-containing protein [Rosettibacter firmus]|uniref:DUF5683 domain-containing protein n=1 Tax=Rosettibacter firmus TaxID=3111522 RepID=UPI00336BC29E
MRILINILLLIALSNNFAQEVINSKDTTEVDTINFIMKKSPAGAVLRSAILPGFGQFYNESYWKIPIIWGALIYLGYNWDNQNKEYKNYRDLYNQSITASNPNGNLRYRDLREFYRDQRDLTTVFIGLTYLLNILDAYVDAHFYDFDVSPSLMKNQINLKVRLSF